MEKSNKIEIDVSHGRFPFSSVILHLSAEAIEWLEGTTEDNEGNKVLHSKIFFGLLRNMRTDSGFDDSFRRPFNLKQGQAQFSENMLATQWSIGRKKMHNFMLKMENLGLIEIYNSRVGSAVTFTCVETWRDKEPAEGSMASVLEKIQHSNPGKSLFEILRDS